MTRKQCAKCPWKQSTDPRQIPNGYCEQRHAELRATISPGVTGLGRGLRMMACHETPVGRELPCVGWLLHELGPGNNIALRLAVSAKRINADVELVGPQHASFEATLPRQERRA